MTNPTPPRQIAFPFAVDGRGRTRTADPARHVRDLVEQLLLTSPGERVNRPTFGTGLATLLFEGTGPELAAATQLVVQGALQQWLGDVIQVAAVEVASDDAALAVTVQYVVLETGERRTDVVERPR